MPDLLFEELPIARLLRARNANCCHAERIVSAFSSKKSVVQHGIGCREAQWSTCSDLALAAQSFH